MGWRRCRVSLNRAYRVTETRAWYVTRAQSLGFVVIAVMVIMAISFLLVLAPLVLRLATSVRALDGNADHGGRQLAHPDCSDGADRSGWSCRIMWLPDGRRRLFDVLPGIGVTLVAWIAGALMFASYLKEFATYVSTYAGLASIMMALVFLYIIAAIFILGAEINAAILKARARAEMRNKALQKT
jgi:membrane protein